MKINILVFQHDCFTNYRSLIENLDRYLEPLIEFGANICLHIDRNSTMFDDIVEYANIKMFDYMVNNSNFKLIEKIRPDRLLEKYDCAILFTCIHRDINSDIIKAINTMRDHDFKFRIFYN